MGHLTVVVHYGCSGWVFTESSIIRETKKQYADEWLNLVPLLLENGCPAGGGGKAPKDAETGLARVGCLGTGL